MDKRAKALEVQDNLASYIGMEYASAEVDKLPKTWRLRHVCEPQQDNGYDCGMFVFM